MKINQTMSYQKQENQIMSYQKQDNHDYLDPDNLNTLNTSNKKLAVTFSVYAVLIWLILNITLNAIGLAVSLDNPNVSCYANKAIASLSEWLQLITVITLIYFGFLLLVILLCLVIEIDNIYAFVLGAPYLIFYFIITIIGINELLYQYSSCKNEIQRICAMVIVIVICNMINIGLLFWAIAKKNNYIQL